MGDYQCHVFIRLIRCNISVSCTVQSNQDVQEYDDDDEREEMVKNHSKRIGEVIKTGEVWSTQNRGNHCANNKSCCIAFIFRVIHADETLKESHNNDGQEGKEPTKMSDTKKAD